jgi:hypothetical protein
LLDSPKLSSPISRLKHSDIIIQESSEIVAFSTHINNTLSSNDPLLSKLLPLSTDPDNIDLFDKVINVKFFSTGYDDTDNNYFQIQNGLILMRLINHIKEGSIDEKKINKSPSMNVYRKVENIQLVLKAAQALGCHIVNIHPEEIIDKKYVTSRLLSIALSVDI